jgi:hypothetical protein
MPDHPAKSLKDKLAADLGDAREAKPSLQKRDTLKRDIGKFYDECLKGAEGWKVNILKDERDRALSSLDEEEAPHEGDKEERRKGKLDEGLNIIKGSLGWVVPRPVDAARVAAVIARDRAAAIAEGHPVGPIAKGG